MVTLPTIHIFITITIQRLVDQTTWRFNAFHHDHFEETIYMRQTLDITNPQHWSYLCWLPRHCMVFNNHPDNDLLHSPTYLQQLGFSQSYADPSFLTYKIISTTIYFLVYVDDILLIGNNTTAVSHLLQKLHYKFKMWDLDRLSYLTSNIQTNYLSITLQLKQTTNALDILQRVGMQDFKSPPNPTSIKTTIITMNKLPFPNPSLYRK